MENSAYLKDYISKNHSSVLNTGNNASNLLTAFCSYFSKFLVNISLDVSCDKRIGSCCTRTLLFFLSFSFLKQSQSLHLVNVPPNYVSQYFESSILTSFSVT